MQNIKNFTPYTPENMTVNALYLKSEDGQDWYECQKLFSPDTIKIVYDSNDVVISFSKDVSALCPVNASVAEVPVDEVPEGMSLGGGWLYREGKVIPKPMDYRKKAEEQRWILYRNAADVISDWKVELLLEMISDENKEKLTNWMRYINTLKSLNFCEVIDEASYNAIAWPEQPAV